MPTTTQAAPLFRQRLFIESLRARLAGCAREHEGCVSLVHFSVDDFETLVERIGQLAAQGTLRMIARVLADVGDGPLCARSGTGRFFVALPGVGLARAIEFAERARLRLANFQLDGTISVGVVQTGSTRPLGATELVDTACRLVEQARRQGGGHIVATTA